MRNFLLFSAAVLCCSLLACTEIIFTQKAKGRVPTEFAGDYYMESMDEDGIMESIFFTVVHVKDAIFELSPHGEAFEEPLLLDIVVRGNDYFINWPDDSLENHWRITSFRIMGDSAYNFMEALTESSGFEEFDVEGQFRRYEKEVVSEDHTRYVVDNRRRETLKAFRAHNDKAVQEHKSILLQKIEPAQTVAPIPGQLSTSTKLIVGPNPFQEQLNVQLPVGKNGNLRLVDLNGKVVQESLDQSDKIDWNLDRLSNGVYFLQWESGEEIQTVKVVKE